MRKTTIVIDVQMGEDDPFHIARAYAERPQLRTDFLLGADPKRDFPSDVGVKRLAAFEQMRALARIHYDDPFRVVNDPCVSGKPFGPVSVGENGEPTSQPASMPLDLRGLDPDGTSLEGI